MTLEDLELNRKEISSKLQNRIFELDSIRMGYAYRSKEYQDLTLFIDYLYRQIYALEHPEEIKTSLYDQLVYNRGREVTHGGA